MKQAWLKCTQCKEEFTIQPLLYGCPSCAGRGVTSSVEVSYDYEALRGVDLFAEAHSGHPQTLWRWSPLLPPAGPNPTTLGEGNTPLAPLKATSKMLRGPQAYLKHEGSNPTGSFKDRLNAVAVGVGVGLGFTHATISSSGNQGVSLGTYAKVAGMDATVFCPPYVEERTLQELLFRGIRPIVLSEYGDAALAMVDELVRNHGYYVSSRNFPRPFGNPFGLEGYKTIAFEIVEQLGRVPDAVFVPTGGGDSIYGVWKGFRELREIGATHDVPRMVACQVGGASLATAMANGQPHAALVQSPPSRGISIRHTQSGDHGLWAVMESNGAALAITEDDIDEALLLVGKDGFCIEPSSATAIAGLLRFSRNNELSDDATVVCIATATGLRWPLTFDHLHTSVQAVPRIDPVVGQLLDLLQA